MKDHNITGVSIFIPCFMDQIYPETGFNMVKVLESLGLKVHYNPGQTCCGQPSFNAGFFNEAKVIAEKFLDDFDNHLPVVVPSASCVGMVRNSYKMLFKEPAEYERYLKYKARVFEFSEFLIDVLGVTEIPKSSLFAKATYHDSCSALREVGIKTGPRQLLSGVEGLELVEMVDNDNCCGFGGTFAVKFEPISIGMAAQKCDNAAKTDADIIISTDSSCLLHLQGYLNKQGSRVRCMHLADVLASGW